MYKEVQASKWMKGDVISIGKVDPIQPSQLAGIAESLRWLQVSKQDVLLVYNLQRSKAFSNEQLYILQLYFTFFYFIF